jgi:hypothetical protein
MRAVVSAGAKLAFNRNFHDQQCVGTVALASRPQAIHLHDSAGISCHRSDDGGAGTAHGHRVVYRASSLGALGTMRLHLPSMTAARVAADAASAGLNVPPVPASVAQPSPLLLAQWGGPGTSPARAPPQRSNIITKRNSGQVPRINSVRLQDNLWTWCVFFQTFISRPDLDNILYCDRSIALKFAQRLYKGGSTWSAI